MVLDHDSYWVVFIRLQDKNGKEARVEREGKSGRVHRGRSNMKGNIREGSRAGKMGIVLDLSLEVR